ncbi:MAG: hypothetical protein ACYTF0_00830 [Planctomycetota bacterium]|jgi:hypothetical protein
MMRRLMIALLLALAWLGAADIPPSPGDASAHPGDRTWRDVHFSHWPSLLYRDEQRHIGWRVPLARQLAIDLERGYRRPDSAYVNPFPWQPGDAGQIGWRSSPSAPFRLPIKPLGEFVGGLLPMPMTAGDHIADFACGRGTRELPLVVAEVTEPWPIAALRDGYPVDAQGRPVALLIDRADSAADRRWAVLRDDAAAAAGPVVAIGDPLQGLDGNLWQDLGADVQRRVVADERHPAHGLLVHMAAIQAAGGCSALLWSPGQLALHAGAWSPEEERALVAIDQYYAAQQQRPRLVLVLPPMPSQQRLRDLAQERRDLLRRSAIGAGWRIVDSERSVQALQVSTGAYAAVAHGEAGRALAVAIAQALADD